MNIFAIKTLFYFFSIMIFMSCISNSHLKISDNSLVELKISTNQSEITDTLRLEVRFLNKSNADIWILANGYEAYIGNGLVWDLGIVYKDTLELASPKLTNFCTPTKKDYICIKPECTYTFMVNANITEWQYDSFKFGDKNINYGVYSIRLTYYDAFRQKSHSLKGKYVSNEIKLVYNRE